LEDQKDPDRALGVERYIDLSLLERLKGTEVDCAVTERVRRTDLVPIENLDCDGVGEEMQKVSPAKGRKKEGGNTNR
jgi:hypothetical protein